ncbi:cysteine-rich and transmembrane domain-containing protein WIH1-like [Durio zibethinus]|uniref:Cysteine-rich and transmembrane domain-containing protein WIH1-like n=1 Tax=Durio zibethinus TaxID=66656 RepID=A0A6P5WHQ2_DURZI|nr:cysteine-rich and transmembrane domain-containing protein WIH1-like [Durio zibethinus]
MSYYNHQQAPVVYRPPPTSYPLAEPGQVYPPPLHQSYPPPPPVQGPYIAPPPVAYPMKNGVEAPQHLPETKQRGDGFWKGCCAGLCCCCLLDLCF